MAGGLFGTSFVANPKCIVFSGTLVAAYIVLPCRYDKYWKYSVTFIAASSYVALAWYDKTYGCDTRMTANPNSILRWAKPQTTRRADGSLFY
jgi:hypothetical protein